MYAEIVRSIEANENAWDSNFDRFESILYRKITHRKTEERQVNTGTSTGSAKKWYCRDWNKTDGCLKNSPHRAWFGTGSSAVSRMVIHMCASCYMKEKTQREHPEGSDACPYKEA